MVAKDRPKLRLTVTSIKEAIRVALKDPNALHDYIELGLSARVENQLDRIIEELGYDDWGIFHYWHMVRRDDYFRSLVDKKLNGINYGQIATPELLYALVRKLIPKVALS